MLLLILLFPVSPKLLETALNIPLDVLWQRPRRVAAAKLDAQRLAENLIKNGLGLVKDVQIAYTDLLLAQERIILATQEAQLKIQIVRLDMARLKSGQISELTAASAYRQGQGRLYTAEDTARRQKHRRRAACIYLLCRPGELKSVLSVEF